jgi:hypothetical protein
MGLVAGKFEQLRVEREIAEEMANSLGRIGRKLARHHRAVWRAMAVWEACPDTAGDGKKRLKETLSHAMVLAEKARYNLIVQREAIGLGDHGEVEKIPSSQNARAAPGGGGPGYPSSLFRRRIFTSSA